MEAQTRPLLGFEYWREIVPTTQSSLEEIREDIVAWLHGRQAWLQEVAFRLLTKGKLGESDILDIVQMLKSDAGRKVVGGRSFPGFSSGSAESAATSEELRLASISQIRGIENLAPRNPLSFGDGRLTVIYGRNGSGKSGYVRILKKACGKQHATELKPNAFGPPPEDRGCTINYVLAGVEHTVRWNANANPLEALQSVDIFDSSCGRVYLDQETEATYTPPAVVLFEDIAESCRRIAEALESEKRALVRELPPLPNQYKDTPTGKIYLSLRTSQAKATLQTLLSWTKTDSDALAKLRERLGAEDPLALVRQKRSAKRELDNLHKSVVEACNLVSPSACERIHDMKQVALESRRQAEVAARATTESAVLEGVGDATWRRLWEAARAYSEQVAYPGMDYPNLDDEDARCVLCHQPLDAEARSRFRDFDLHIRGTFEKEASTAEKECDEAIKELPTRPTKEVLQTQFQAAGLEDDNVVKGVEEIWDAIETSVRSLSDCSATAKPAGVDWRQFPILTQMKALSAELEERAAQLERDADGFDRAAVEAQILDLEARRWTSQQATAIRAEIKRLQLLAQYDEWKQATNTTAISRKAGTVADSLLTTAYIERFNNELERLGARHIRVELAKTRTQRGRPKHRIRLRGARSGGVNPSDILSEGERRIVVLAAFLADVSAKAQATPFVFDDPISSLDQTYEESVAERLIELSQDRQVIVFTHRLSLLGLLRDKSEPEEIHLRMESWGSGQPAQTPLFAKRPIRALRSLRDESLAKAARVLRDQGHDTYYPLGKAACTDFRILMERIVETELLADVVQRHRRALHTKNKVRKLARITAEDCELVEKVMDKYSRFEHSQSSEATVEIPPPDEIHADIDSILAWHKAFTDRGNSSGA